MNENVKATCVCELGYDKGALKKTIENNIFTIYGNVNKNKYIVIRYHGELIDNIVYENYTNNLSISYFFDDNVENPETITLAKCTKCIGENYCALIPLEEHNSISFKFILAPLLEKSNTENSPNENNMLFKLSIEKDPIADILQKYGLEENNKLPVVEQESSLQIKNIILTIKRFFLSLFRKKYAS